MKILALHLYHFMEYAQQRGVVMADVLATLKHPPEDFRAPDATLTVSDFYAGLHHIHTSLGDPMLGVRAGDFMNLKAMGLIYQISLQNTSIEEALLYLQTYLEATLPMVNVGTYADKDNTVITLKINDGDPLVNQIIVDHIGTVIARELRMMIGDILSLHIQSPKHTEHHPAHWTSGDHFCIVFTATVLKAKLLDRSRWQLDLLIPAYLKMIEGLKLDTSFTNQVKIAILNLAKPELPDLDIIADNFNMTARTFQRRLDAEKTTFRKITDAIKKQISYLLLRHDRFSIADISYVLGYAEPAAFIHSFKKWYGSSPDKMRQQLTLQQLDLQP